MSQLAGNWLSVMRTIGSLLPKRRSKKAGGRVLRPWIEDATRSYPSIGLTPSRALALLQAADGGAPQEQYELYREMLQKWPRLCAVEATRRLALTGLAWEITPDDAVAPDTPRAEIARQVADYCSETLMGLDRFRDALNHMAFGIGFGVAVAELVWESGRLIDITPAPYSRLTADPQAPWRLRVRTDESPAFGVALDETPNKWIVHQQAATPGRPFEGGLLRASILLYLAQNLSFKDWLIFSQVAGMPMRVGRFEPGAPEDEKRRLLDMLKAMGPDAAAIFSKAMDVQFIEANRGETPYQAIQDYCNTEVTILWLGQHLTTDIRASGSRAAAEIHDRVREDLLVDDIAAEAATVRRDLLKPLSQARFGADAPVPVFRRSLIQSVDTKTLAETLAVAVRELGIEAPRRWAHRALGIPTPAKGESVLSATTEGTP